MSMALVLGLDSGGTKTLLAFADRCGNVVRLVRSGGLDPSSSPDWPLDLADLLAEEDQAGAAEAAVLGLPFHDEVPRFTEQQTRVAEALLPSPVLVQNDVRIAFDGAFAGAGGVLVLAGTGSMAWASRGGAADRHVRVGGWGDAFGDEGSAYWIGRETLAAVSRDLDGRLCAPDLTKGVLEAIGCTPGGLIDWTYALTNRRSGLAQLAVVASRLAEDGVAAARAVLERGADHLAEQAIAAWRGTGADTPLRWSHAGGVLDSRIVRARIAEKLGCGPVAPRLPPIGGALLRAAQAAGWPAGDRWINRLAVSLGTSSHQDARHLEGIDA